MCGLFLVKNGNLNSFFSIDECGEYYVGRVQVVLRVDVTRWRATEVGSGWLISVRLLG